MSLVYQINLDRGKKALNYKSHKKSCHICHPENTGDEIDGRDDGQKRDRPSMTGQMRVMHRASNASRSHHNGQKCIESAL